MGIIKKVYVFDWDGTIFESMKIKYKNFSSSLYELHKNDVENDDFTKEKILDIYKELSGIPRREIYIEIMKIFNIVFLESKYNVFSLNLSENNKKSLLDANVYPDATYFLKKLIGEKNVYISSSVPQEELSYLVKNKLPDSIQEKLSGVYGSKDGFSKGIEHFRKIIENENVTKEEIIFFGDDFMDLNLAKDADVDFILINRDNKKTEHKFLKNFNEGKVL